MSPPVLWQPAPAQYTLEVDEVHVWRAGLNLSAAGLEACARLLSEEEQARAARFYLAVHRRRFTVAHGVLRALLGRYLGCAPRELAFCRGAQGKPLLEKPGHPPLRFNISHARELALYALARGREVGIDLEDAKRQVAGEWMARRFFAAAEVAALEEVPPAQKQGAFLAAWTRKEAYLKARGEGLAAGLDSFAVSLRPGAPPALLHDENEEISRWRLCELGPGSGYLAALCVEGEDWRLRCWEWEDF